jgi:hypothetical protein
MGWRVTPFHRLILDALEASRSEPLPEDSLFLKLAGRAPGWAKVGDVEVLLAPGVYDLHAVARCVRDRLEQGPAGSVTGFRAAFSRGVRELIHAGKLEELHLIPIIKAIPAKHPLVERSSNGALLDCSDVPLRFVRRSERPGVVPRPGPVAPP